MTGRQQRAAAAPGLLLWTTVAPRLLLGPFDRVRARAASPEQVRCGPPPARSDGPEAAPQ